MRKVRKGVYETNSSSTHSITVDANTGYTSISPNSDGVISVVGDGEYGWRVEKFFSVEERLNYISIYARDWADEDSKDFLGQIKTVVDDHTGATLEFNWGYDGYIDHQSVERNDYHYLFKEDKLKDFIFGNGSFFETDNDNY